MNITLDLEDVYDRNDLYELIYRRLPFDVPAEELTKNLDALYDLLTEFGQGWTIHIINYETFLEEEPQYFRKLKRMLKDAEIDTPDLYISFSSAEDDEDEADEYDPTSDLYNDPDDNYTDQDDYDAML